MTDATAAGTPASPERAAIAREAARRRTFAIISHPDAGKTTLTEKLLLYAGMVNEAGMVRGRKNSRAATSDWMAMERERGISVTATALSFEFRGHRVNLIDTPGHQDFSEDTYRVLNAADAAVMVLDAVKGIEPQTEKLFRVCADRHVPILTFVNKLDRPGADPLGCLSQIENVLGIAAAPVNWPIGTGREFRGVLDLTTDLVSVYETVPHGSQAVPTESASRSEARGTLLSDEEADKLADEADLLSAGDAFDRELFLAGKQTPVFFGSALTNFGVEPFLAAFLKLAPSPGPRPAASGDVPPDRPDFTGVVFKMQANLDPRHRDRVAFVRVCTGRFERDSEVTIARTGERFRVRRSVRLFGQERETIDDAYPGDVIGIVTSAPLRLGDTIGTLAGDEPVRYTGRWSFPPERFAVLRCEDTGRRKQFVKGVEQLGNEGVVQLLIDPARSSLEPVLAAVGELQFDVVKFRMESEYGAKTIVTPLPYHSAHWLSGPEAALADPALRSDVKLAHDRDGRPVLLAETDWGLRMTRERNPELTFDPNPPAGGV